MSDNKTEKIPIKIVKISHNAIIPKYKTNGSSGFDLHILVYKGEGYATVVHPGKTELMRTGLAMQIPLGYELQIRPRSGLSLESKLRIANSPGTIDADYTGEIKIIVENIGDTPIIIGHHDRIAQGVLCKVPQAEFVEVEELSETIRGQGGFGSTGK